MARALTDSDLLQSARPTKVNAIFDEVGYTRTIGFFELVRTSRHRGHQGSSSVGVLQPGQKRSHVDVSEIEPPVPGFVVKPKIATIAEVAGYRDAV
jgi:hypothetical protein